MTFTLDPEVAAVLPAAGDPPPAPPVGDVAGRRVALDAMLRFFNNEAQPVAGKVDISDHSVVTPDGGAHLFEGAVFPVKPPALITLRNRSRG